MIRTLPLRPLFFSMAVLILLLGSTQDGRAQNFSALDGLPTARAEAESVLGPDAIPVIIGAPGEFELQDIPIPIEFDLETGKATLWGYVFYSPSEQQFRSFAVVRLFTYQVFEVGDLPIELPGDLVTEVNTDATYADSDNMINRLETDTAYQKYRTDLPDVKPTFAMLTGPADREPMQLPNGFPTGQGLWSMSFQGGGDSTMTCVVASETGEAFCRRIYGLPTTSVNDGENGDENTVTLSVAPNPVRSGSNVTLNLAGLPRHRSRECTLLLYDAAGAVVLDLSAQLSIGSGSVVSFDSGMLPSGTYYCRLAGADVHDSVTSIVIQ